MRGQESGVQRAGCGRMRVGLGHCDVIKQPDKKLCRNQGKVRKVLLECQGVKVGVL